MAAFFKKKVPGIYTQFKNLFLSVCTRTYDLNHISGTHMEVIWRQEASRVYVKCSVDLTMCVVYIYLIIFLGVHITGY